jgi:hypothetical protein
LVSISNVNQYPNGATASIYWGGAGQGPNPSATQNITTGPINLGPNVGVTTLNDFIGQDLQNFNYQGHYNLPRTLQFTWKLQSCIHG